MKKLDTEDLFTKYSKIYYDDLDQKTDVLTKRSFNTLISELFINDNFDRLSLLKDIKKTFEAEYDSYIEAKSKLDPTTLNDTGYWASLLGKIEVIERQIKYINEYIRHIKNEEKNT